MLIEAFLHSTALQQMETSTKLDHLIVIHELVHPPCKREVMCQTMSIFLFVYSALAFVSGLVCGWLWVGSC